MGRKKPFEYEIQYTKAADKFLKAHEEIRKQYEEAIHELLLGDHPEKVDVKRIQGKWQDVYRIRLGSIRLVYTIIEGKIVVIKTLLASPRGDVYKKIKRAEIKQKANGLKTAYLPFAFLFCFCSIFTVLMYLSEFMYLSDLFNSFLRFI